jgi:hypothetical protein
LPTNNETQAQPLWIRKFGLLFALITLLVLALGAIDDWYTPAYANDLYGSDAICYLDIARAIQAGDWRSALNPLWSQGYPLVLVAVRHAFAAGPKGDFYAVHTLNFIIFTFSYVAFFYLIFTGIRSLEIRHPSLSQKGKYFIILAGVTIFLTTQLCIADAFEIKPDQFVAALVFLASALMLKLLQRVTVARSLLFGLVLGFGFIVKAFFLPLGCLFLAALVLTFLVRKQAITPLLPAGLLFLIFVGSYGAALSHEVGHPTLGEAGGLNYQWHVNRMQKWIHWEGGALPGDEAWPKHWMVRFTHWDSNPPNFGTPIHPSKILQTNPIIYGFSAPVHSTYTPYYDPPYFYQGYRPVFSWRYQAVALAKSAIDLATVVFLQPMLYILLVFFAMAIWLKRDRDRILQVVRRFQQLWLVAILALAVYFPVHLEGRYIAPFLAILLTILLIGSAFAFDSFGLKKQIVVFLLLALGVTGELAKAQHETWSRALHHWNYQDNFTWRWGQAIIRTGLPAGSTIGMISTSGNIHCDWAYIAHLQITSEIASPADSEAFWRSSPEQQQKTLETFRRAGATAVVSWDRPAGAYAPGWQPVDDGWIYWLK